MEKAHVASRAITNAAIATVYEGKRMVRKYESGERLVGVIPRDALDDAPPFTGFVRGYGKKEKTNGRK